MYIYLFLAFLVMVPFFKDVFSGGRRNSKDTHSGSGGRQNSGGSRSSSQQDLCEVSGHDHSFRSSLFRPLIRSLVDDTTRSVGNDPSLSRARVSFTHTAEELVHEPINRPASTRLAISPENLRSVDTAHPDTPGKLSFFFSCFLHR